jgi:alpha-1,3-rhamnosyl/mannosyltransferase
LVQRSKLRALRELGEYLFHGPAFWLPESSGPSVATIHDLSVFRFPEYHPAARAQMLQQEIANSVVRADRLIAVSDFVRQEIIEVFGVAPERVAAIHNGVAPGFHPRASTELTPLLNRRGLRCGSYVLCVATLEPRKNLTTLIHAYRLLPEPLRSRFPLVLAGPKGWGEIGKLDKEIDAGARKGWLRHIGYVNDAELPSLMAGAAGLAYPSLYEGFGLPLAEAMASGVPAVISNVSSLPEVAAGSALEVQPHDVDAMAMALQRMIEDSAWRDSAIARGLAVARRYTWERAAAETVEVYQEILSKRGLAP